MAHPAIPRHEDHLVADERPDPETLLPEDHPVTAAGPRPLEPTAGPDLVIIHDDHSQDEYNPDHLTLLHQDDYLADMTSSVQDIHTNL